MSGYRPSWGGRLRYTYGGRLPRHTRWVRHDLTDAGWRRRLLGRIAGQVAPLLVVAGLLPGPVEIRALLALLVLLPALFVGAAFGEELRDRRLRQHGLEPPEDAAPGRPF